MSEIEQYIVKAYRDLKESGDVTTSSILRKRLIYKLYFETEKPLQNEYLKMALEDELADIRERNFVSNPFDYERLIKRTRPELSLINSLIYIKLVQAGEVDYLTNQELQDMIVKERFLLRTSIWTTYMQMYISDKLLNKNELLDHYIMRSLFAMYANLSLPTEIDDTDELITYDSYVIDSEQPAEAFINEIIETVGIDSNYYDKVAKSYMTMLLANLHYGKKDAVQYFLMKLKLFIHSEHFMYPDVLFLEKELLANQW